MAGDTSYDAGRLNAMAGDASYSAGPRNDIGLLRGDVVGQDPANDELTTETADPDYLSVEDAT
eukprot:6808769-Alexandrium_andersonii.AAC.1